MAIKNLKALIQEVSATEDQTQTQVFREARVIPGGKTLARFTGYIEFGVQPRKPHNGKPKDPAEEVGLTFELLGSKNIREVENKEGEKFTVTDKVHINLTKSFTQNANYKKLFEKMRRGREDIKHMAQMLGEAFVVHVTLSKPDAKGKIHANLRDDSGFRVEDTREEDPETGKTKVYKVPEAKMEIQFFSFQCPNAESWNSIYIDKKNWIQEKIMRAVNYPGSAVEELLSGGLVTHETSDEEAVELEDVAEEEIVEEEAVEEVEVVKVAPKKMTTVVKPVFKTAGIVKPTGVVKKVVAAKVATKAKTDALASLGL